MSGFGPLNAARVLTSQNILCFNVCTRKAKHTRPRVENKERAWELLALQYYSLVYFVLMVGQKNTDTRGEIARCMKGWQLIMGK